MDKQVLSGSQRLFVNLLEDSLLLDTYAAFRTFPSRGKLFKWCARGNSVPGISLGRIVDIRTFQAFISQYTAITAHLHAPSGSLRVMVCGSDILYRNWSLQVGGRSGIRNGSTETVGFPRLIDKHRRGDHRRPSPRFVTGC